MLLRGADLLSGNRYVSKTVSGALRVLNDAVVEGRGRRNNALFWTSAALGNLVGAGALDRAEAESLLWEAIGPALTDSADPMSRREATTTIASGLAKGEASPAEIPEQQTSRPRARRPKQTGPPPVVLTPELLAALRSTLPKASDAPEPPVTGPDNQAPPWTPEPPVTAPERPTTWLPWTPGAELPALIGGRSATVVDAQPGPLMGDPVRLLVRWTPDWLQWIPSREAIPVEKTDERE